MTTEKKEVSIDEKDLFDEKNVPESSWFKFSKVGDRVMGTVVEVFQKESKDNTFPDQRVFVLKQKNGELINVGIKMTSDYLIGRTNQVEPGDIVGFEFTKEIPAAKKGYHPAKSITPYVRKGVKPEPDPIADGLK